jgi:CRP-like cAMP-binding protein
MVNIQDIRQIELFAGLTQEQCEVVASLASETQRRAGEFLFQEGGKASLLYILLSGKILIQVQLTSRPERITITSLGRHGQVVGWSGLVKGQNYSASAYCQEDCRLLSIDGAQLSQALEQDPAMGFAVTRRLSEVISDRLRNIQRVVLKTL